MVLENNDHDAFLTHAAVVGLLGSTDMQGILQMSGAPQKAIRRSPAMPATLGTTRDCASLEGRRPTAELWSGTGDQ